MTAGLKTGRSIQEFWVDFLLEEEFDCDPTFAVAFASACGLALDAAHPIVVAHSVCDQFGEADLVVTFRVADSGEIAALLLENKITASFQPDQALRYRMRGDHGIAQGLWQHYQTVLVAPARYIQANHGFDEALSLETLRGWICRADPARRSFKVARLQKAIDKKNSTGVQIVDQALTDFREAYRALLEERSAGFIPPASRLAYAGDYWLQWTSANLPGNCKFRHRLHTGINSKDGALDLSVVGVSADQLQTITPFLPAGFEIVTIGTGNPRGAMECRIEAIKDFTDFEKVRPVVESALEQAEVMQSLVIEHGRDRLAFA